MSNKRSGHEIEHHQTAHAAREQLEQLRLVDVRVVAADVGAAHAGICPAGDPALLAVEPESEFIITYNRRDFAGTETFGIKVLTPKEFLQKIGEIKSVAEKMSALLAGEYLEKRAARGSRTRFKRALARVPDREPEERDRL